jgi:hypothetical protein
MDHNRIAWPDRPPQGSLSISHSSENAFNRCERGWLIEYGYSQFGKIFGFEFRRQKPLVTLKMLAGSVVDSTLTLALAKRSQGSDWPSLKGMQAFAGKLLDKHVDWSREYRAMKEGDRWGYPQTFHGVTPQPLMGVYYGFPVSEGEVRDVLSHVQTCLRRWVDAGFQDDFDAVPLSQWHVPRSPEKAATPWFWLDDDPAYASFDFLVLGEGDGETQIFDWKTGDPDASRGLALDQLVGYAAFAHVNYGVPLDRIRIAPVYLSEDPVTCSFTTVDSARLQRKLGEWRDRLALLHERVAAYRSDPKGAVSAFPMTDDLEACRYCKYHACEGYRYVEARLGSPSAHSDEADPFEWGAD